MYDLDIVSFKIKKNKKETVKLGVVITLSGFHLGWKSELFILNQFL